MSRVGISVPHRKVAARNMDADAVTFLKDVGSCHQIDGVLFDFSRRQKARRLPNRLTEPGANDALGEVVGSTVRGKRQLTGR